MAIQFNSSDQFNNFFNTSLGRNKNNGTLNLFNSINLNDYNSLKTGTYKRLLSSYYEKVDGDSDKGTTDVKDKLLSNISGVDEVTKEISKSSEALSNKVSDLEEYKYEESDRNNIVKDIKSVVSSYNKVLDGVDKAKDSNLTTKAKWMTNYTKDFEKDFNKIGITIEKDNKLKVDEETLKKANLDDMKKLFVGKASFGSNLVTVSGIVTYL